MENTDQPSKRQCRRFQAWGLVAVGSALITVGCAQPLPKYVASSHGPQAQLVMRGDVQPGETYGVYLFQDPLNCGGMQQVGVGIVSRDPETTSIAAGLTTAEVFLTKTNRSICRTSASSASDPNTPAASRTALWPTSHAVLALVPRSSIASR